MSQLEHNLATRVQGVSHLEHSLVTHVQDVPSGAPPSQVQGVPFGAQSGFSGTGCRNWSIAWLLRPPALKTDPGGFHFHLGALTKELASRFRQASLQPIQLICFPNTNLKTSHLFSGGERKRAKKTFQSKTISQSEH